MVAGGGLCVLLFLLMLFLYPERAFTKYRLIFYTFVVLFSTRHGVTRKIDTLEVGLFFVRPGDIRSDIVNVMNLRAAGASALQVD